MIKLKDKYYDAVVVGKDIDPKRGGAVRVKIFGVTDELDIKQQPFAIPAVNSLTGVPTEGTYLEVMFDEGDPNKPKYFNSSAETSYLPKDYVNDGYPDIAVANLGGDLFASRHDRKKKDTLITHPNESDILWDSFGRISHDSDHAYEENADQAGTANEEIGGSKVLPVLTQGTVDIFTCRVFGAGANAMQGSEYLFTAHISKETVNKIKGMVTDSNTETEINQPDQQVDVPEYKKVLDEDVLWKKSPSGIEKDDRNIANINRIVVTASGSESFLDAAVIVDSEDNDQSVHYIVGRRDHAPDTDGSVKGTDTEIEEVDISSGFMQTVDLKDEATWFPAGTKSTINKMNDVNKDSVIILVIAKNIDDKNSYQREKIDKIKQHVINTVVAVGGSSSAIEMEEV